MRTALVSPYSWTYPGGVTRHIEALAAELLAPVGGVGGGAGPGKIVDGQHEIPGELTDHGRSWCRHGPSLTRNNARCTNRRLRGS